MLSVNNVSSGKSSSYMAIHYPTDLNIFACVLTNDLNARPKDKYLLQYAQSKLPQFEASRELDLSLYVLIELEQMLGKKIIWISADYTYDELIAKHNAVPNSKMRFCTEELKVKPILYYLYNNHYQGESVFSQIGYRADEQRNTDLCSIISVPLAKGESTDRRRKYKKVDIRENYFPLIENNITIKEVLAWAETTKLVFPSVSNCDFCFFHTQSELLRQASLYPERVHWWIEQEDKIGRTFANRKVKGGCSCA